MKSQASNKIAITPKQAITLIGEYSKKKISQQLRAVGFIILYLIAFQLLILNVSIANPFALFFSLVAVVLGLAFFLEGLFLSVMPLAEMAGAELPTKVPLIITLGLAFFLGILATLAEPAMVVLQEVTDALPMHQTPLLYYLFNYQSGLFIGALGLGVGIAILLGSLRTLRNFALKPLIIALVLLALTTSILAYLDPRSRPMVALAWDAGGIATGAVTVPLIIAFGLGLGRTAGNSGQSNGLGIVTLANLAPINTVLILSLVMRSSVPMPAEDLATFLENPLAQEFSQIAKTSTSAISSEISLWLGYIKSAFNAVGPLVLALVGIILIFIRKRPNFVDEKVLGILFSILGIFFLSYGIQNGLSVLGRDVGSNIYSVIEHQSSSPKIIKAFDLEQLEYAIDANGERAAFFKLAINNDIRYVPFEIQRYDAATQSYMLESTHPLILEQEVTQHWSRILLFLAFFILLGFGAAVAEPTLHALANTLSELTAGSFPKAQLIQQVALGVGLGLAIGVIRMMIDVPFIYILIPLYLVALILTLFSESTYMAIAWDAAGVATGPITVPLVISVGLGVNQHLPSDEQFGLLTIGATIPILILLSVSLRAKIQQQRMQREGDHA